MKETHQTLRQTLHTNLNLFVILAFIILVLEKAHMPFLSSSRGGVFYDFFPMYDLIDSAGNNGLTIQNYIFYSVVFIKPIIQACIRMVLVSTINNIFENKFKFYVLICELFVSFYFFKYAMFIFTYNRYPQYLDAVVMTVVTLVFLFRYYKKQIDYA